MPDGFGARFEDAYRRELQAWAAGLAAGRAVGASAWDGYAASAVAEACLASLEAGERRAIRLAARPELYAPGSVAGHRVVAPAPREARAASARAARRSAGPEARGRRRRDGRLIRPPGSVTGQAAR